MFNEVVQVIKMVICLIIIIFPMNLKPSIVKGFPIGTIQISAISLSIVYSTPKSDNTELVISIEVEHR